jgi:hypothetical protein
MDGALVIAESHNPLWLEWEWRASIHVFPPRRATAIRSKLLRAPWWWVMSSIVMWAIIHSHLLWIILGSNWNYFAAWQEGEIQNCGHWIITLFYIGSSLWVSHMFTKLWKELIMFFSIIFDSLSEIKEL